MEVLKQLPDSTPPSPHYLYAKTPRISLVGAGPGDPDLISVKGLRSIQQADVILYDALVNPVLLEEAPTGSLKIYVGKRAGNHSYSQDSINQLMVELARAHGHVVRLKGGDPFVFGRGHEEMAYANAQGIPVHLVPGISSCTSLAGLQKVPLTCRGINESFWVLTAVTRNGSLSKDLDGAARSSATVVILMGIARLTTISALFAKHRGKETPAMIVQNGSTDREKCVVGTLGDIVDLARANNMGAPGLIVIGEVVGLHPALQGEEEIQQHMVG